MQILTDVLKFKIIHHILRKFNMIQESEEIFRKLVKF